MSFYILKITASNTTDPESREVIIRYDKDLKHGKIHFLALDYKMASNLYSRNTGQEPPEILNVDVTCYNERGQIAFYNSRTLHSSNYVEQTQVA